MNRSTKLGEAPNRRVESHQLYIGEYSEGKKKSILKVKEEYSEGKRRVF